MTPPSATSQTTAGTPLSIPSTMARRLAAQLGVDRTTVTEAYAELQAMGYVRSRPGSYTIVQMRGGEAPGTSGRKPGIDWRRLVRREAEEVYRIFKGPSPETPAGAAGVPVTVFA